MLRKIYLISLAVVFLTADIFSTKYYVDGANPAAKDSNPGTEALPFKTIQKGINTAVAGDTVIVKYSTYFENIVIKNSGNITAGRIVIRGNDSITRPVIDARSIIGVTQVVFWFGPGGTPVDYVSFENFEILTRTDPTENIFAVWINGDYNVVKNCKIQQADFTAIQLSSGSYNLISNNEIISPGWNAISWEANTDGNGRRCDYNIIELNYIDNLNYHTAINGFPYQSGGNWYLFGGEGNMVRFNRITNSLEGMYFRVEKSLSIYGNIIDNITGSAGIHFDHFPDSTNELYLSNSKIYNNVIANCKQDGILNTNALGLDIKNNIFFKNRLHTPTEDDYDLVFDPLVNSPTHQIDYNIYFGEYSVQDQVNLYGSAYTIPQMYSTFGFEEHGSFADPLFVNEPSDSFNIQPTSPARDNGVALDTPYNVDIVGTFRPQNLLFDIGAYELIYPLPVELNNFSAKVFPDSVILSWTTVTEINNYGFEIQRSEDKNNWGILGFVAGNGNSNSIKNYSFTDKNLERKTVFYRLKQIDNDGAFEYSSIIELDLGINESFELLQNYPNPFNPTTEIKVKNNVESFSRLKIFDVLGREIETLLSGNLKPGVYNFEWNAKNFPSGVYLYRFESGRNSSIKKMILLR
ncbi:MAG: right-handed parallel beta-helix repeat-containing protein [Ignavibacteriaceae bacterium]|nr:right-handed parallel beta-helix repeat-containing protein [Ignavibacteriaceae bacterium]